MADILDFTSIQSAQDEWMNLSLIENPFPPDADPGVHALLDYYASNAYGLALEANDTLPFLHLLNLVKSLIPLYINPDYSYDVKLLHKPNHDPNVQRHDAAVELSLRDDQTRTSITLNATHIDECPDHQGIALTEEFTEGLPRDGRMSLFAITQYILASLCGDKPETITWCHTGIPNKKMAKYTFDWVKPVYVWLTING